MTLIPKFAHHPILSIVIATLFIGLSTGCGITGGTSARKVALNPALGNASLMRTVSVGTVTARPEAGINRAIGAYNLGKFDDADLATLRETLKRSLPPASTSGPSVHVVVQHFGLSFTNNRGAGLAIIDWCAADGSRVLTSERFYAAYDTGDKLFGTETLGMAKNRILHASAARIAERALAAANGLPPPPAPALTFDNPETANATLPSHMVAVGAPGLVNSVVQQTMLGGFEGATRLLPEPIPPMTDWSARLAKGTGP